MAQSRKKALMDKQIFSTGEAAKICRVSQQTIIRCFDTGRIKGTRVPGSRFRRIPRAELIRFMKANGISTDAIEGQCKRILVLDQDGDRAKVIDETLEADARFKVESAATSYDAGIKTARFRPHLILVDELPSLDWEAITQRLRDHPDLCTTKVVRLSDIAPASSGQGPKPPHQDRLAARIREALNM